MHRLANTAGAALALLAAVFWFLSAYGDVPPIAAYWGSAPAAAPFYGAKRLERRNRAPACPVPSTVELDLANR